MRNDPVWFIHMFQLHDLQNVYSSSLWRINVIIFAESNKPPPPQRGLKYIDLKDDTVSNEISTIVKRCSSAFTHCPVDDKQRPILPDRDRINPPIFNIYLP